MEAGSRHAETRGGFVAIHCASRNREVSRKKSVDDLVVLLEKPVPPRLGAGVFLRVHVDDFVARNAGQATHRIASTVKSSVARIRRGVARTELTQADRDG